MFGRGLNRDVVNDPSTQERWRDYKRKAHYVLTHEANDEPHVLLRARFMPRTRARGMQGKK
eukprot:185332-Chlamydomonas_euryale.AAC.1